MFKDYLLNEVENAIFKGIQEKKLGNMQEYKDKVLNIEKPKNTDFGDFAVNVSPLAKNAKLNPFQIAETINDNLSKKDYDASIIGGFINFKLGNDLLASLIKEICSKKDNFAKPENINKEKINLEYVSANPTGPFHIGHGRWAAMGSALANLLKFYGHNVYQEFYINDAGSQIQKLGNSLSIRIKQELGENIDFPTDETARKNYYTGDYLIPVAKKFLQTNKPTEDTEFLASYAKNEMEERQKVLLKTFKVHFDKFYSELELHNSGKVEKSVQDLNAKGKLYEKDGALWFKSTDYGDDQDRVIRKADGSNTYLTADIAYHIDKLERDFDRMINIWGADHHGYVARVKASIAAQGYNPDRLEVLLGQLVNLIVNGEQTRMGKRRNMITLDDLIEEVGVDATRFWMCMRSIDTTLDFDIELAKTASDENPVFYVQYAHARACSILRNALTSKINSQTGHTIEPVLFESDFYEFINNFDKLILINDIQNARKLVLKLEEYKPIIKTSAENRTVYTICRYVQELAAEFHSFYNATRVINDDKNLTKARLTLVWAVKTVLKNGLDLLAVSAPERM